MQSEALAPVVMFVYNRPEHTKKSLDSLKQNKLAAESILYVFADGPKTGATAAYKEQLEATRRLVKNTTGFKDVIVFEKEFNLGLARSVISGVSEIVNKHGKVIVLEDDLVLSPYFLEFMNEGLRTFQNSPNIYSINGYMFDLNALNNPDKVVLLPYTSTWGWATWQSRWRVFNTEMPGRDFLKSNPFLKTRFNLGDYSYTNMLDFGNNAWGIKWYFSVFTRGGLNVYPSRSLVRNIGFDGSGTNGKGPDQKPADFKDLKINVTQTEQMDLEFFDAFINHFKKENISLLRRIIKVFIKR
jgi:hypothetical protein